MHFQIIEIYLKPVSHFQAVTQESSSQILFSALLYLYFSTIPYSFLYWIYASFWQWHHIAEHPKLRFGLTDVYKVYEAMKGNTDLNWFVWRFWTFIDSSEDTDDPCY